VKELNARRWCCSETHAWQHRTGARRTAGPALLAPFSSGLPPVLLDRLRAAARDLGLPESLIATVAIALFLEGEGF
jgi:hypothetical protein